MIADRIGRHKSCYQLIKTMTIFEKETKHQLYMSVFRKKKKTTVNSVKCKTTVCTHDTFCPLELNLWQPRTNPVSGRAEYLNPGPPNYESSTLNPQPYCLLLKCSVFRDSKYIQSFWKVMKKKKIIFLIDVFLCTSVLPAQSL